MPENIDLGAKIAKEIREKIEDTSKLVEETFHNVSPLNCDQSVIAASHSHKLLKEAREALRHNDKEEAAHKLRREVDFCNKLPEITGSVYEKTGKAGLKALSDQKSSLEIIRAMEGTWKNNWAEDPKALWERF